MWIEVSSKLINLDNIIRVEKDNKSLEIHFYSYQDNLVACEFSNEVELEQVYFNLLESIKSKPIDGFRE